MELFFFLIRAHPKVKTILNKARHSPAIKMHPSCCAVSPCRGWEKCYVYLSGKGTLIKKLMAGWALNFRCCISSASAWNCILEIIMLLRWVVPGRNTCSKVNRKIQAQNRMCCPLCSLVVVIQQEMPSASNVQRFADDSFPHYHT